MSKIIFGQYDSNEYPLKRYFYEEVPDKIKDLLVNLNLDDLAIFRGGLAFIFLLDEKEYMLKDLDMLALKLNLDRIVQRLSCADIVYVNHNTVGDMVVTAFWKTEHGFYKLDILLCDEMPPVSVCLYDGIKRKTISVSYLWRNRIEKIAEKEQRKHSIKKTLNHYRVACKLNEYLLKHTAEINFDDSKTVKMKRKAAETVLKTLIPEQDMTSFFTVLDDVLRS